MSDDDYRGKAKEPRISAQVPTWVFNALEAMAERDKVSMSLIIRRFLVAGLKRSLLNAEIKPKVKAP